MARPHIRGCRPYLARPSTSIRARLLSGRSVDIVPSFIACGASHGNACDTVHWRLPHVRGGFDHEGEGNDFSDIDLVVVYSELARAWQESFVFPVEALVHDAETLAYFVEKDIESHTPVIVHMLARGVIVGDTSGPANAMQQRAQNILDKGPKPLAGVQFNTKRYFLSDLADDLRVETPTKAFSTFRPLCPTAPHIPGEELLAVRFVRIRLARGGLNKD